MSITLAVIIGIALPAMVQQVPAAERKPKTQERKSGNKGTPSKRKVRKKGAKKLGKKGVEVRIGPKFKPFRTLGAAFTDLLKYRLQGGNLEGVTITPNETTIAGLKPQLRDFHERVINHKFVDIPTQAELFEIESLLAPFQELDQFRIDPQILHDNSWESIQASMEEMRNIILSKAGVGVEPTTIAAVAAVVVAGWNTYNGVMAIYDPHYKDTDNDGTIDSEDPEPMNPKVPKKKKNKEKKDITAESEAGAMMLVDTNAIDLLSYDLLRQYKIQYRPRRSGG